MKTQIDDNLIRKKTNNMLIIKNKKKLEKEREEMKSAYLFRKILKAENIIHNY
jgi:hypothetical protein